MTPRMKRQKRRVILMANKKQAAPAETANTKKNTKIKRIGGLNTSYLTKMGLRNLIANRTMSFSSISVLTACLLLIGVSVVLLGNMQKLVSDVEKQNVVVAFVKDGVDDAGLLDIYKKLISIENVGVKDEDAESADGAEASADGAAAAQIPAVVTIADMENGENGVRLVRKQEAFDEQLDEFGVEREVIEDVIENPLPDSFRITVSNIESFSTTLAQIKVVENIESVRESQEIVNQITTMQKSITLICMILVAVLIIVSLFIIINTIRITMVSRRIDIQVMKSVGATNAFISWPFMIEGVFIGLFSGAIAFGLTFVLEMGEGSALKSLFALFGSDVVSVRDFLPYSVFAYILAGIILGAFGSVVSLLRYLKKEGSESELNL